MLNADSSFARLQSGAAQECLMRNFFSFRTKVHYAKVQINVDATK